MADRPLGAVCHPPAASDRSKRFHVNECLVCRAVVSVVFTVWLFVSDEGARRQYTDGTTSELRFPYNRRSHFTLFLLAIILE